MKRRDFILITSAGVAALAVPTLYFALRNNDYDILLAQPQSLAYIWDTDTILAIGQNYLEQVPKEKNERLLVKRLLANTSNDSGNIASAMEQKIKKDFKTKNTVMVDGWILSVTEARQCALFSLTLINN